MFNQTEYQYVNDLLINYYNNGFHNYMCITNNPIDTYNNSYYDIYCYVSKDKITYSNNSFKFNSGYKLSIDSNTYSNNNLIDKLVKETISNNTTISHNSKEYVYSNISGFADVLGDYSTSLNNHLDLNAFYLIPALLMLLFVLSFVKSCFRSRR